MGVTKKNQPHGALDLLVLRTLGSTAESLHGYAITERIHRLSDDVLRIEEGSLYPALHRMESAGWVSSEWGVSENNRRARYYAITKAGRRRLTKVQQEWAQQVEAVKRVIRLA